MTSVIQFLDTPRTIAVETPLALEIEWGDRISRMRSGPSVYGSLTGQPYGTAGDLRVEVGVGVGVGVAGQWRNGPVTVRASVDGYDATETLTEAQREAALATYAAVGAAWRAAVETDAEIAAAVEDYRKILDEIDAQFAATDRQWEIDRAKIAKAFRRARVDIGEQTVPGKCCVRSTRGTLLGYAHVLNGRWLGTVERLKRGNR